MANFGKGFAQGFDLSPKTNLITRYILQQGRYEREDEERLAEQKRKEEEQFNAEKSFQELLQGGKYQQEIVPTIKEKTPSKFLMQNFGNKYETENTTQEVFRPLSSIEEAIMYGRLPDDLRSAYKFYKDNNKPEKPQEKKKLLTTSGYNKSGEKEVFIKYDDGSELRVPTGFYKEKSSGNNGTNFKDKFNPQKFNKTLDGFTDGLVKINGLRQQYETSGSEFIKSNINLLNETNEALLRTIISEDDEMNTAVNDFYDELKETFGNDFRDVEISKQNELKGKFLETMKQKAIDGDLPMDKFRALSLWIQFKYGYQY